MLKLIEREAGRIENRESMPMMSMIDDGGVSLQLADALTVDWPACAGRAARDRQAARGVVARFGVRQGALHCSTAATG